jgi:hypothetical protein
MEILVWMRPDQSVALGHECRHGRDADPSRSIELGPDHVSIPPIAQRRAKVLRLEVELLRDVGEDLG